MPVIEISESNLERLQKAALQLYSPRVAAEQALVDLAKSKGKDVSSPKVLAEIAQILARFGGRGIPADEALDSVLRYCEAGMGHPEFPVTAVQRDSRHSEIRDFRGDTPPDLRHTRLLRARFGRRPATGWNNLVHAAHIEALLSVGSLEMLRKVSKSNVLIGHVRALRKRKKATTMLPKLVLRYRTCPLSMRGLTFSAWPGKRNWR